MVRMDRLFEARVSGLRKKDSKVVCLQKVEGPEIVLGLSRW
jgi:hypothetical protein